MPFACAHRGLSSELPENTLKAFGGAVTAGFPAVEMDLQLTKDGEVVILHDETIDRTTDGKGRLADLTLKQLAQHETPAGPVPRLADLFKALKAWDGLYNLEVKDANATAAMLDLVREHLVAGRVLVSSMDPEALHEARSLAPHVPRALIPFGPVGDDDLEVAQQAACLWLNVDHDFVDADDVAAWRKAGLRVGTWTVNDPRRAKELVVMGVDCVITDVRAVGDAVKAVAAPTWGTQAPSKAV